MIISIPKGSIKSIFAAETQSKLSKISIPKGSIKSFIASQFALESNLFQFQKVRLKECAAAITARVAPNFNSKRFD